MFEFELLEMERFSLTSFKPHRPLATAFFPSIEITQKSGDDDEALGFLSGFVHIRAQHNTRPRVSHIIALFCAIPHFLQGRMPKPCPFLIADSVSKLLKACPDTNSGFSAPCCRPSDAGRRAAGVSLFSCSL